MIPLLAVVVFILVITLVYSVVSRRIDARPAAYSCREEWLRDVYGDVPLDVITARLKVSPPGVLKIRRDQDDDPLKGINTYADALGVILGAAAVMVAPALGGLIRAGKK